MKALTKKYMAFHHEILAKNALKRQDPGKGHHVCITKTPEVAMCIQEGYNPVTLM